jgi:hypothetical protein
MKSSIKRLMAAAMVVVIGAGLGLAPVAAAATGTHASATPTAPPPAPPQYETGTDPLVPSNTGAMPFVLVPRGNGLAF